MKAKAWMAALAVSALAWAVVPAQAAPITFTGSSGFLSASATFDRSGTNLIVTLTNTSNVDVHDQADILTAVFFTLAGDPTLTRVSALLASGSTVEFGPSNGGNLGGEWAYRDNLAAPNGADEGISSSGLGLFGPPDRFENTNLQGPPSGSPDGVQYGLTSAGDNTATGNSAVTGNNALIKNSMVFTLNGLPMGFDPAALDSITNVSFQYGTALNEPRFSGVSSATPTPTPEPGTWVLMGTGLVGLVGYGWRRRQHQAA